MFFPHAFSCSCFLARVFLFVFSCSLFLVRVFLFAFSCSRFLARVFLLAFSCSRFLARVFLLAISCWLPEIVFALVHEFLFTCLSTCANVYPYLFVGKTLHYRVYDACIVYTMRQP